MVKKYKIHNFIYFHILFKIANNYYFETINNQPFENFLACMNIRRLFLQLQLLLWKNYVLRKRKKVIYLAQYDIYIQLFNKIFFS
jgi:hypothetical protein